MKSRVFGLWACLVLLVGPNEVCADAWPKLEGERHSVCAQALALGRTIFVSNAFYLFVPPDIPWNFESELVLRPQGLDLSAGDALAVDATVFDRIFGEAEATPRGIYWQMKALHGQRLVLREHPLGWRGDMYSLFAVSENLSPDEVVSMARDGAAAAKLKPILSDSWRPPLIFRSRENGDFWIIDVGQPYEFLAAWEVLLVESGGARTQCVVRFRSKVDRATDRLPMAVRELSRLLDHTIGGQGEDEGTLQPTARLLLKAEHTWANAALRPWVSGEPYNTREEVDAALRKWSQASATQRKLYQRILRQYSRAERALATYYQRYFQLSAAQAKTQSVYILDVAFRSHYVFPRAESESPVRTRDDRANPWPR